ncbi:cobalamin biosynthesis protein CobW [Constrictibacter sp. MBR-5]|jgi:cobalamin biosynthesis protein CobW|uniref:cobalamin biosynthesis protein CobW n=1 Tax=Constrictibacter sp. MBR-5 TaxID=3156467 RepID=UPI0033978157
MSANPIGKIPATVITGFLGAGKTSAIRHLLANAGGRRIALVINEFGDLGIDGEIVRGCGIEGCDDVVELANGCICCTVADDFLPTILAILARPNRPDHIVIETSGLALPKPLVRAFGWPEIRTRVTVDGVIAMVDGRAVADGLFASNPRAVQAQREADEMLDHESPLEELFEEQIGCADMVVINKTDQLDDAALARATAAVERELRPGARIVRAVQGAVDPAVLLGLSAAAESDLDSRPSHHDGTDDHDHDDFDSFVVELPEIASPQVFASRIALAVAEFDILRVKGFAAVAGKDMRLVVQGVGPRLQHYFDRGWQPGEARRTRLVVIGHHGLDAAAVSARLAA